MTDHPEHGGPTSGHTPEPERAPLVGRAAMVLIAFIIATAVALGQVHPAARSTSATIATTAPVTSTTHPGAHPTTTTPPTITTPPAKVSVLVANGSNVSGAAGTTSTQLQAGGWTLLPPVNASSNVTASVVYYVAGYQPSAVVIAKSLGLGTTAVQPLTSSAPVGKVGTANVVVVVGPDVASRGSSPATTTTTKAATTTTTKAKSH
jgi:LytR cell envelope-related transcriptional attenuator